MKTFLCVFTFLIFGFSNLAKANDGYSAIGAGGIEFKKSDDINMYSEILTISEESVNVKYEFRIADFAKIKSKKALISFPLPLISCGHWGQRKVPEQFTVLVNGKKVNYLTEMKAFKQGKDVTNEIKKAGLPVDCRDLEKNKELLAKAKKAKWYDDYNGNDPDEVFYQTRIIFYWEQDFPANQTVNIEHSYIPVLGEDTGSPTWFYNRAPHWDRDPKFAWEKINDNLEHRISSVKGGKSLEYILTTANTWMGGVDKFTLIIKRKNSDSFVGSTLGPLKQIDKNTFEFRTENFRPDRELTVFFGNSK